jgi:tetratricopeptide (TPR) repeat protein
MRRPWLIMALVLLSLLPAWSGAVPAPGDSQINQLLVESYDLLEAGKLDQAKAKFQEILQDNPGNPLALNNLAYIMVKENNYPEALKYLEQALPQAGGWRVRVNRVCEAAGICLAYRPAQQVYGDTPLPPLIKMNIDMVKARLATRK